MVDATDKTVNITEILVLVVGSGVKIFVRVRVLP
jgi:hypothetical protein